MDKLASTSISKDENGFNIKGLKTGLINIGIAIVTSGRLLFSQPEMMLLASLQTVYELGGGN